MCAVTVPFSIENRIFSPACTMGTVGSGGVKQPHAAASRNPLAARRPSTPGRIASIRFIRNLRAGPARVVCCDAHAMGKALQCQQVVGGATTENREEATDF